MIYRLFADLIVVVHFAFVLFVVLGGLLVLRWPKLVWLHVPVAVYGVLIELVGWVCPLTPWENRLRRLGGDAGYEGGFVEQYIVSLLYPEGLTPGIQIALGVGVLVINLALYGIVIRKARRRRG
jgi:hypothetical protein